jgi:hypothetical protein
MRPGGAAQAAVARRADPTENNENYYNYALELMPHAGRPDFWRTDEIES